MCAAGCGAVYCSDACRARAWEDGHEYLCVGAIPDALAPVHPLFRFVVHAVQTNEILLLVAKVVAKIIASHEKKTALDGDGDGGQGGEAWTLGDSMQQFADFVRLPWWEVVAAATPDPEKAEAMAESLKALCADSAALLAEALDAVPGGRREMYEALFTVDFFGRTVGM